MSESNFLGVTAQQRRSRAEADRLVAEYEESGQTRKEFSQARGISMHTLDAWRRRKSRSREGGRVLPVELVEGGAARLAGPMQRCGALRVLLAGGHRIEVEAGFDAGELTRLIAALEGA